MRTIVHLPVVSGRDAFAAQLAATGQSLERASLSTLQLNLGKLCDLSCEHCHVEAGPERTEAMTWPTMRRILGWIDEHRDALDLEVVDLTGGAPEMNPHFRDLVTELRLRRLRVRDRCNLTILLKPGYEDLADFLAVHRVEIVASLPSCFEADIEQQRGRGVYHESITALRKLNAMGYGRPTCRGASLRLDLESNPVGHDLPAARADQARAYRRHLAEEWGITFNRLWTITNMPIGRFEQTLRRAGKYDRYLAGLRAMHRPANVEHVMCRSLVNVGWRGGVYDCDFNQMLQMPMERVHFTLGADADAMEADARKLWHFTPAELVARPIRTGAHCFGCTAGAGSHLTEPSA